MTSILFRNLPLFDSYILLKSDTNLWNADGEAVGGTECHIGQTFVVIIDATVRIVFVLFKLRDRKSVV